MDKKMKKESIMFGDKLNFDYLIVITEKLFTIQNT